MTGKREQKLFYNLGNYIPTSLTDVQTHIELGLPGEVDRRNRGNFTVSLYTTCFRYAMPSDAGIYECQISTEPKMSRCVHLDVKGERDLRFCTGCSDKTDHSQVSHQYASPSGAFFKERSDTYDGLVSYHVPCEKSS